MDEYSINRKAADAYMDSQQFTSEQVTHLRRKAKTNLFFLSSGILGYNKLTTGLHLDFCKWAKRTSLDQYRLALLPRSHYKSTVFTIGDSIQIALPDDSQDQPYPRNLGTSCRVLIAHETSEASARFLNSITQHFCTNPVLMGLFPECVPSPRTQRINKLELELPRNSIWSEPTFDTVGVAGKSQGRHYNYVKCDDIYGAAARDSKAERESTILWVDNLQSLLISPKSDHIDFIGTRWAHDDAYAHIIEKYETNLSTYIRACEEPEKDAKTGKLTGKNVAIFPEEFPPESLRILKKNRTVWNAQYANDPYRGGSSFEESWLRYYNWKDKHKLFIFDSKGTRTIDTRELDRVILIDPAMTGLAGYCVTGTDSRMNVYVLEAQKQEWTPPEFVNFLFQQVQKWNPRIVVIEDVLFSGLYEHWLLREMLIRGIKFKVEPLKTENQKKPVRVAQLSNFFSAGQIYFNNGQDLLIEEYLKFGATENYHILDALSQGTRKTREGRPIWRAAVNLQLAEKQREAEQKIMNSRDPQTGY